MFNGPWNLATNWKICVDFSVWFCCLSIINKSLLKVLLSWAGKKYYLELNVVELCVVWPTCHQHNKQQLTARKIIPFSQALCALLRSKWMVSSYSSSMHLPSQSSYARTQSNPNSFLSFKNCNFLKQWKPWFFKAMDVKHIAVIARAKTTSNVAILILMLILH